MPKRRKKRQCRARRLAGGYDFVYRKVIHVTECKFHDLILAWRTSGLSFKFKRTRSHDVESLEICWLTVFTFHFNLATTLQPQIANVLLVAIMAASCTLMSKQTLALPLQE